MEHSACSRGTEVLFSEFMFGYSARNRKPRFALWGIYALGFLVTAGYFCPSVRAQGLPPDPAPDASGPPNIFYGSVPPEGAKGPVIVFVHGLKGIAADWW